MSMPTILPTGQLHPDLFNGPFVKHISSTPAAAGEPGAKVHGGAIAERRTQMEERVNKAWRENRDSVRACLKSFDKRRREADNREKQAGVGGNASISK